MQNGNNSDRVPSEILRGVLKSYSTRIRPVRIEPLGNRAGFSGAQIWRVATERGDFALRRWPNPGLNRARLVGLHRLLEHLGSEHITFVAVPLPSDDGPTMLHMHSHDWQLEPWMPGLADYHAHPTRERLRAAMTALAQWHRTAQQFVPTGPSAEWFVSRSAAPPPSVNERLTRLQLIDQRALSRVEQAIGQSPREPFGDLSRRVLDLFRRAQPAVAAELRLLQTVAVRLHPCLRDVWHDHILFVGDDVSGVIDPSACRTEHVSCDLSRLIGSLVRDDRATWDFALAEYQRHRPLTADELALVTVLDRSGVLLSGWTWLEWIHLERRAFPDVSTVSKRLTEIAARMEWLFKGGSPATNTIVLP